MQNITSPAELSLTFGVITDLNYLYGTCYTDTGRMENSSDFHPSEMTLTFGDVSEHRILYCTITLLGYIMTVTASTIVVVTIVLHKPLQEPMYVFIAILCVNGLYGSMIFYPSLLINLLYQLHTISYTACLTQVYCLYTYGSFEMTTLTAMAFDRYVCICNPLRYNVIMSLSMVARLISGSWLFSIIIIGINVTLTSRLPLCDSVILKIYCDNWSVVRLSCIDTTVNNIFGLFVAAVYLFFLLFLILSSYISILRVCYKSSAEVISKALQACMPQFITTITFVTDVLFEFFIYRWTPTNLPYEVRMFMSIQPLVTPPLLNPLLYGLKMTEIRLRIFQLLRLKKISSHKGPQNYALLQEEEEEPGASEEEDDEDDGEKEDGEKEKEDSEEQDGEKKKNKVKTDHSSEKSKLLKSDITE
ncbi:olfactory receptor 10J5-like [Hyperolius riggenbachi]|uniref:olfactory receptor 10J5-like n=1 Tax=Hyperolius riggenbachi TaxID=752182 RepID=UPI0035A359F2